MPGLSSPSNPTSLYLLLYLDFDVTINYVYYCYKRQARRGQDWCSALWRLRRDSLLKRLLSSVIRENCEVREGEGPIEPWGYRVVASARLEKPAVSSKTSSIRENRGKGDISGGASRYEGFGGKPPSRRPVKQRKRPSPVRPWLLPRH